MLTKLEAAFTVGSLGLQLIEVL